MIGIPAGGATAQAKGRLGRTVRAFLVSTGLLCGLVPFVRAQVCSETPGLPPPLGSPSGCDLCLYYLLAGSLEASPDTRYYVESDLPEKLLATGVLYASVPVLPPDRNGNPTLDMRTQIASGGFVTIDDSFDVLVWHTSSPGDGTQPRRLVVYARNEGTGPIQILPLQILVTDGGYTQMSGTLGERVLENDWDTLLASVPVAAGTGEVIAYSKQFAASYNSSDTSANTNCFGRVRAVVQNSDPVSHPTNVKLYVVAIDGANPSQNKSRAEALLGTGATSGDPFDLNTPPSGCANRRATGVFETFVWRNDPLTLDANDLPDDGIRFRMTLGQVNSQSCPAGRQTADMALRPGYVRPDTVGNYMVDYRVALRLINTDFVVPREVDVRFGKSDTSIGLAWQVAIGADTPTDAEVDARPARTGWAGASPSPAQRSFLESDGGPIVLGPCEARVVSIHFLILGGSSLPFEILVASSVASESVVDNADAAFSVVGTWTPSSLSGCYGSDSLVHAGNAGLDKALWTFWPLASGQYDVFAWWVAASNRANAAPYDIHHLGGTARVEKNQTTGGSAWNLLGRYDFAAGTNGVVELSDDVPPSKYVSADAVKLTYVGPIEEIVDNRDPEFSAVGAWPTSANSGYYGVDSLYHAGDGGVSSATWRPVLPYTGRYEVYAWWVVSSNRAKQAPYEILHRRGTTTVYKDQTDLATMSRWNDLGGFDFDAGTTGAVVLRAAVPPTQLVSADAVRFVFVSLLDATAPAAPTGLAAVGLDAAVHLDWLDNAEPDLDGYNVYRADASGGPFARLNGSLVRSSTYGDESVANGVTYYYVVTAADAAGNESAYSDEASATPHHVPGDTDGDGDVDLNDFATWYPCLTGPGVTPGGGCVDMDLDTDGDVDLEDFAAFQEAWTGPG